jgi:hypothetical protein
MRDKKRERERERERGVSEPKQGITVKCTFHSCHGYLKSILSATVQTKKTIYVILRTQREPIKKKNSKGSQT